MKKTILLVEDDQFLAKLYASYFEDTEYEVIIEPEGEQGVFRMHNHKVDLVILDILMPKKNGYEFLKECKADDVCKNVPIIVLTSLEQEADKKLALELGASDFFMKNELDLSVLMKKVESLIGS